MLILHRRMTVPYRTQLSNVKMLLFRGFSRLFAAATAAIEIKSIVVKQ